MASRSDQIFQKRKAKQKKDLARQQPSLPERQRVLIICEGEKTEPLYLRALIANLGLTTAEIEVCGECDSAPTSVVSFGKDRYDTDTDFDLVYFVFDRDSHADYDSALRMIREFQQQRSNAGTIFTAITSIPCFEIWFLLHFEPHTRPYGAGGNKSPCGNLISVLKQKPEFKGYKKGHAHYFELLSGRLIQARKNSALTLKQSQAAGEPANHGNPTTLMHVLIDALEGVVAEYR